MRRGRSVEAQCDGNMLCGISCLAVDCVSCHTPNCLAWAGAGRQLARQPGNVGGAHWPGFCSETSRSHLRGETIRPEPLVCGSRHHHDRAEGVYIHIERSGIGLGTNPALLECLSLGLHQNRPTSEWNRSRILFASRDAAGEVVSSSSSKGA